MKKPNQGVSTFLVVAFVASIIIFVVGGVLTGLIKLPKGSEDRSNPVPISPDRLLLSSGISAGKNIVVDEVKLLVDGYVVVNKDNGGSVGTELGRSELLKVGTHDHISITTKSDMHDGDVVLARLVDKNGTQIKDVNGNVIEVQKNVGMPHGHYDQSEY